ncbi:SMI1/KNR4 family protein [Paenibacillus sp. 1011MAR3C5]|uniref:SMI1/KNR4 family protein n=1 Tax=Paenibacillus sp. 1011MAR3C5 TaxID=1675787 RepID=UPI000E6C0B4D|nr:SMI1/KNR4 family protein [Paenibacillus sp. 1011MAR3C5]RJE87051.1 SMI1/KNR4 family protein [Paenibacillus sp. 1011MAR3C5]
MKKKISEFISWANENGWDISPKSDVQLRLDSSVTTRYKTIPNEYVDFLSMVEKCISPNEKTWFICEDEFNNSADDAFRWNEFELLSLEAAADDRNWQSEITSWWDHYLPIVMSVDGGYSFFAIDLTNDKGVIVRGYEPEFEEVEKAADSLEHLLDLIMSNSIAV